eukprot:1160811-Pelagomonas_calceolata.AAC.9
MITQDHRKQNPNFDDLYQLDKTVAVLGTISAVQRVEEMRTISQLYRVYCSPFPAHGNTSTHVCARFCISADPA